MIRAYVLINVEPNQEYEVVKKLEKIKSVKNADIVFGEFDIIATVEAEDMPSLSKTLKEIRTKTKGVKKTSTMITAESYKKMLVG